MRSYGLWGWSVSDLSGWVYYVLCNEGVRERVARGSDWLVD